MHPRRAAQQQYMRARRLRPGASEAASSAEICPVRCQSAPQHRSRRLRTAALAPPPAHDVATAQDESTSGTRTLSRLRIADEAGSRGLPVGESATPSPAYRDKITARPLTAHRRPHFPTSFDMEQVPASSIAAKPGDAHRTHVPGDDPHPADRPTSCLALWTTRRLFHSTARRFRVAADVSHRADFPECSPTRVAWHHAPISTNRPRWTHPSTQSPKLSVHSLII